MHSHTIIIYTLCEFYRNICFNFFLLIIECRRIRDELANQVQETSNLTNTLDRVSKLRDNLELLIDNLELWKCGW